MSSGWNGIPIRSLGKVRQKLAEMLCRLTGCLVEPEDLKRTNPYHRHFEDCCAWDCWATRAGTPPMKVHIYSWDTMTACVRSGIDLVRNDQESTGGINAYDMEVSARSPLTGFSKMKYAHLTIEVRLVSHGVQVDMFDRTLSTHDGQGIIHRTAVWDFADSKPVKDRVISMQEAIYQALRKVE